MFVNEQMGHLVPISGIGPTGVSWEHVAFVPAPLPGQEPPLSGRAYRVVARARAELAAMNAMAQQLPDPSLFRLPTLRREAQSTSELEGTFAPLRDVLTADGADQTSPQLREVLNYVAAADHSFDWFSSGRGLTVGLLTELQETLTRGTPTESRASGKIRDVQVVIGRSAADTVHTARFVPPPPGIGLTAAVNGLVDWFREQHADIDPVVACAMCHYQFETLHPFVDGNGRIGRLLVVLQLLSQKVLLEPTISVSPWFESRRSEYYNHLLTVSTSGDWDSWVLFFATGLAESARTTREQLVRLSGVQTNLRNAVRRSSLRAGTAHALIDFAVANPAFTVGRAAQHLGVGYGRANKLVSDLVDLGALEQLDVNSGYDRRFCAPAVIDVLLAAGTESSESGSAGRPVS
jgi:Fic family protein